jgi:hypothetical protein
MFIAKRNPLMHRQLGREPGVVKHYAGLVAVCVAALTAAAFSVTQLKAPRPASAASSFAAETGTGTDLRDAEAPATALALPGARDAIPDTAVDDANARVITSLRQ